MVTKGDRKMYSDILGNIKLEDLVCEHCGNYSEFLPVDGLCERCQEKINNEELIGWRNGE